MRAVGFGFVMFLAIFGGATVLINTFPDLYPRGTGWGALVVASVPWFAAGYTTGRYSEERSSIRRALLGAVLGALVVTAAIAWPYLEGARLPRHLVIGMCVASVTICAVAAGLGKPRANRPMEPTR